MSAGIILSNTSLPSVASISANYGQSRQSTFVMNNIYSNESIIYHTYARMSTVKLSLFAPKLELSDNFRYVIENLSVTGTYTLVVEKYIQDYIFNYFGFTYITELLLDEKLEFSSGIAQMLTVIEKSSITPMEGEGFSASQMIALSFSGALYQNKQNLNDWFARIENNSVVIKYTTQSIFDLITSERFPNDTNIDTKAQYIMQAFEQYINKTSTVYCENKC
ncbi:hypothetical protein I4U23_005034 [Adineta vaga]|nr:hypothetical protein I4U23_005034 [Adineta vaga]